MQNKKLLTYGGGLVVLVVVFFLGISVGTEYQSPRSPVTEDLARSTASLMIDHGNGNVSTYHDLSGATVFDVLRQAAEKNGVDLKYKEYGGGMGVFIESIDGTGNDPTGKKWWQYWVNNTYSQVGASSHDIQSGDVIEFKFIEGQE